MGVSNQEKLPVVETEASERQAWVRPEVRRMTAGSAEEGAGSVPDAGSFPS